ncbi:UNKNOWN [Stylonychia lemnae]|uniref:Uncharacterized protein n=1 Tax=Stylonychia lemnae TaxID=5949 RepID=A0A077ZNJ0_STYLE|nr:UNKNOWN [Stylonychia lemnae]|eukprot:CDW71478.1 UNKNOWN [Stylonychia lemnae]
MINEKANSIETREALQQSDIKVEQLNPIGLSKKTSLNFNKQGGLTKQVTLIQNHIKLNTSSENVLNDYDPQKDMNLLLSDLRQKRVALLQTFQEKFNNKLELFSDYGMTNEDEDKEIQEEVDRLNIMQFIRIDNQIVQADSIIDYEEFYQIKKKMRKAQISKQINNSNDKSGLIEAENEMKLVEKSQTINQTINSEENNKNIKSQETIGQVSLMQNSKSVPRNVNDNAKIFKPQYTLAQSRRVNDKLDFLISKKKYKLPQFSHSQAINKTFTGYQENLQDTSNLLTNNIRMIKMKDFFNPQSSIINYPIHQYQPDSSHINNSQSSQKLESQYKSILYKKEVIIQNEEKHNRELQKYVKHIGGIQKIEQNEMYQVQSKEKLTEDSETYDDFVIEQGAIDFKINNILDDINKSIRVL